VNPVATLHICAVTPSGLAPLQFRRQVSRPFSAWRCGQEENNEAKKYSSAFHHLPVSSLLALAGDRSSAACDLSVGNGSLLRQTRQRMGGPRRSAAAEWDFTRVIEFDPHRLTLTPLCQETKKFR
jgi:hypothetical protein